jgi:hypothetical protein
LESPTSNFILRGFVWSLGFTASGLAACLQIDRGKSIFADYYGFMALQEEFENQGNFLFKYRGIIPLVFLAAGIGAFV